MAKTTARPSWHRTRRVCLAGLLVLLALLDGSRLSSQVSQTIGGYILVSQQQQKNSSTLFTYRATLTNNDGPLASATATARSMSGSVKIVDGSLTFGAVGSGGSVVSTDTFSFTRNTNQKFDFSSIAWTITPIPNHAPVANAGADLTQSLGGTAQLDGSASTDQDGNPLTYQWTFVSRPAGSQATLSSPTAVKPTFLVDKPGSYTIQLVVNDGFVNSAADNVVVTTSNSAPVANAGTDKTVFVEQTVTLDGSASSDVDGNSLTFAWSFASRPDGSGAVLTNPTSVMPTFIVDVPGMYVVRLIVNDGTVDSAPDTVAITTVNSPPVANAGPDQTVFVTNTVTLDGSGSTDVDGNPLTYAWALISKPAGSVAALSSSTAVQPTFVADKSGVYVAQLVVNDGTVSGAPDTVSISTQNTAPVANAGPDQTILVGGLVQLDGTASSDVDGDPFTFRWSLTTKPLGSTAALFGDTTAGPSFTVDKPGIFVVQLIVNDGLVDSVPDTVTITTTNSTPTANAGPDQIGVLVGTNASLDGTASADPDHQPLSYAWSLLSKPAASTATISGATNATATLPIDASGDYVAQLIVNDGFVDSAPDTVLIHGNAAPVANAGPDQQVTVGNAVQLDGSASSDPDGNPIVYDWQITSLPGGSSATLTAPTSPTPGFVADTIGTYSIQLTVRDSFGAFSTDLVSVAASPIASVVPSITLQPVDVTVAAGQTATFTAAATGIPDPTVQWQVSTDGGTTFADVPGAASATLAFITTPADNAKKFRAVFSNTAGSALTTVATLTVTVTTDDEAVTVSDAVVIDAAPLLRPLANQTVDADTDVHFTAVAIDPGDAVLYSLIGAPTGATIDPATGFFSWQTTGALAGTYSFFVLATDSVGLTDQTPISITVRVFVHSIDESIVVNDAVEIVPIPLISLMAIDPDASESGPDPGAVRFVRVGDASAPLIVNYSIAGTATNGADYARLAGAVGFAPGQTFVDLAITPVDDAVVESPETVTLTLIDGVDYDLADPISATVTIADNDQVTPFNVSGATSMTSTSVAVTFDAPPNTAEATAAANYTIPGLIVSGSPLLAGNVVTLATSPQSAVVYTVSVAGVTRASDSEPLTTFAADFTGRAGFNVTAAVSTGPTSVTVTFDAPPNSTQAATIGNYSVAGLALSGTPTLAGNSVTLTTSTQTAAALYTLNVSGVTRASDGEALTNSSADFTGHGINTISVEALDANASEVGPDPGTVRFTRAGDATLGLIVGVTIGGTATNGVDYQPSLTNAVVFQPGEVFTDVTITPVDDGLLEGSETVVVSVIPGAGYALGATTTATVSIADSALAVTNTNDSGTGSLRQAILNANAHTGVTDTISFNIPGAGLQTISPLSALPTITDPVIIDGTTQPGYTGQPVIELDGSLAGANADGLLIAAGNSTIQGLIVNRFGTGGSGAGGSGIVLQGPGNNNVIQGNVLGTDATGSAQLPNRSAGISIASSSSNIIGDALGEAHVNTIAFNGAAGIAILSGSGNAIYANAIFGNTGLGIDLGNDGVTSNDPADTDPGANNLQNFPILTSALSAGGTTTIHGTLNSVPSTQFLLQFFTSGACNLSGHGEGATFLGSQLSSTDEAGDATFDAAFQIAIATGQLITATATHPDGSTSEFSACADVNPSILLTPDSLNLNTLDSGTLTVSLSHSAPVGGQTVDLSSSDAALSSVPQTVQVPEGTTSTTFTATTGTAAGTATVTASAAGFSDGTSHVTASLRTMTLTPQSPLVAVGHSLSATINLAQAAPAGGVTITLASSDSSLVSVSPPSVTIAAGDQSASLSITGVAAGSAMISATAAGFATATQLITATTSSLISLGSAVVVAPGLDVGLPLSLGQPAPLGGVTVSLSSTDTSVATVTPSVFIPAGLQIPAANPNVHGVKIGTAQIVATATGFAPDTASVTVTVSIGLSPNPLNVIQGLTGNATLTLSSPAPAGGLTFNASIDNTAFATVPATVQIGAGATSAPVPVTAVSVGSTTLRVSAPGVTETTTAVSVQAAPVITVGDATIGKDLQASMGGTLGAAAPSGNLQVTIASLDSSKLLLATSPTAAGASSVVVTVGTGTSTIPTFYLQALVGTGTATIQTSAPGYATDTSTITFRPSGFLLVTNNFTTTTASGNTSLVVQAEYLDPITFVASGSPQALRAGISVDVPVASSNTSVGGIVASLSDFTPVNHVTFNGGDLSKTAAFDPVGAGTANITLTQPTGFQAATTGQQITATVTAAPAINVNDATIGKDLQVSLSGSLGAPAPAGNLQVTITSPDPSKVLVSTTPTQVGVASITLMVSAGSASIPTFYVQALSDTGPVDLQITAPNYATDTSRVTLRPSGFLMNVACAAPPQPCFTTTVFSSNTSLSVLLEYLNPTGTPPTYVASGVAQGLRPGLTVDVTLASSDTSVGTIVGSPLTFNGGDSSKTAAFDPVGGGSAVISLTQPPGFTTPTTGQQITVAVTAPAINIGDPIIGKDLQALVNGSLGAPVPAGTTLDVTITSLDPTRVLLSKTATQVAGQPAGFASITITMAAGTSSIPGFYVQALTDFTDPNNPALLRTTAPGYTTDSSTVLFRHAGFSLSTGNFQTTTFSANTGIVVVSEYLNTTGNPPTYTASGVTQGVRAGLSVDVPIASSDTNVGNVVTSVSNSTPIDHMTFNAGDSSKTVAFDPITGGTATIGLTTPTGFTTATTGQQITATVTAPNITVGSPIVGLDLQTTVFISLGATPPSPVDVVVTSNDAAIATITKDGTVVGGSTLTFTGVTSTSVGSIVVQGRRTGTTTITVQAPGYNDGTGNVAVNPSGFVLSPSTLTTTPFSANSGLNVSTAILLANLNLLTTGQPLRAGLSSVTVPMTSSNTSVGTVVDSVTHLPITSLVFNAGDSSKSAQFDPASVGTTTVSLGTPAGFSTPNSGQNLAVTVNTPNINITSSVTVGLNLQALVNVNLSVAPPSGVDVTVTSNNDTIAKLATVANKTSLGGTSVTFTNVTTTTSLPFYVQALALGTTTLTVHASSGYNDATTNITVTPSGFYIVGPASISTHVASANTTLTIGAARLDPVTLNFVTPQDVRGGLSSLSIAVTSSDISVGTIVGSPVTFNGGDSTKTLSFDPAAVGTTTISIPTPPPAGFSTPSNLQSIVATVSP